MEIAEYVGGALVRRYVGGKGMEAVQETRRGAYGRAAKAAALGLAAAAAVYLAPAVGGAARLAGDLIPGAILHASAGTRSTQTMRELDEYVGGVREAPPRALGLAGDLAARATRATIDRHMAAGMEGSGRALWDYAQGAALRGPTGRGEGRQLVGAPRG